MGHNLVLIDFDILDEFQADRELLIDFAEYFVVCFVGLTDPAPLADLYISIVLVRYRFPLGQHVR